MTCFPHMISKIYAIGVAIADGLTPIEDSSRIECMEMCVRDSTCSSFFFNQQINSCYLHPRWIKNILEEQPSSNINYFVLYPDRCQLPGYQFVKKGNMCLKFSSDMKTWDQARTECEQRGGRLVKLDTQDKMSGITDIIITDYNKTTFWTGGHDPSHTRTWKWTDGSPITFTAWTPGAPNGQATEFCIHINFKMRSLWNDCPCSITQRYVCERLI